MDLSYADMEASWEMLSVFMREAVDKGFVWVPGTLPSVFRVRCVRRHMPCTLSWIAASDV